MSLRAINSKRWKNEENEENWDIYRFCWEQLLLARRLFVCCFADSVASADFVGSAGFFESADLAKFVRQVRDSVTNSRELPEEK